MNLRFRNALNNNGKPAKTENTVRNGRVQGNPRLDEILTEKLDLLVESLFSLHKRNYSSLTLNEKRLVEMFCKRYYVNIKGDSWKEGEDKFTILKLGAYQHKFIVYHLKSYFGMPNYNKFHIVEDEKMDINNLYSTPTTKRMVDPLIQALINFPKEYHPVRAFNNMPGLMAIYSGRSQKTLEEYQYKERLSLVPDEALYVNPLVPTSVQTVLEEEVIVAKEPEPESNHLVISKFLKAIDSGVASPVVAAVYDVFAQNPEAFKSKFNMTPEFPEDILASLKFTPRESEAYLVNLEQLV